MSDLSTDIQNDILTKEKEISEENARLYRARFERERTLLERTIALKDTEIIKLRDQQAALNAKLEKLKAEIDNKEAFETERVKANIIELELFKKNEQQRWIEVLERVKCFQQEAETNQKKVFTEQEKQLSIRKNYLAKEEKLKSEIADLCAELSELREAGFKKEEGYLREGQSIKEKIYQLEEQLKIKDQEALSIKTHSERTINAKDEQLKKLENAVQLTAIALNTLRKSKDEALEDLGKAESAIKELEAQLKTLRQEHEIAVLALKKSFNAEQDSWSEARQELMTVHEADLKALRGEMARIKQSNEHLEQELIKLTNSKEDLIKTLTYKEGELTALNQKFMALTLELNAKIEQERGILSKTRDEHANEIDNIKADHRNELEKLLKKNSELKISLKRLLQTKPPFTSEN